MNQFPEYMFTRRGTKSANPKHAICLSLLFLRAQVHFRCLFQQKKLFI